MKKNLLYSICVPVYNVEKYLHECVKSVLNQTYGNFELILVDDGSKDCSYQICKEFQSKDDRIRAFTKENGGQISAREFAFNYASGDIILCVDSDDYIESRTLEILNNYFEEQNPDCIYFNWQRVSDAEIIDTKKEIDGLLRIDCSKEILKKICSNAYYNSMCLKAFKKDLLPKIKLKNFYKFRHGEDLVQTLMILESAKSALFIPDVLYDYRVNVESVSYKGTMAKYNSRFFIRSYVYSYLKEKNLFTDKDWDDYGKYCVEAFCGIVYDISTFKTSLKEKKNFFNEIRLSQYFKSFLYNKKTKRMVNNIVLTLFKMKMDFLVVLMCFVLKIIKDVRNIIKKCLS